MHFAHMTAPEIRALDGDRTLVVSPIAACEQHSDHLPVITDTVLVGAVADGLEANRPDRVLVLPVQWLGASEHHLPFGGTLTATLPTYEQMLIEILSPLLREGFRRVMLLNGHGGNIDPLHVALRRLDVMFPDALLTSGSYWELAAGPLAELCEVPPKSVGHACEVETSMMMHVRPDLVRADRIRDDPSPGDFPPALFHAVNFARRTDHGAVGYPSFANAEKGKRMLDAIVAKVTEVSDRILEAP